MYTNRENISLALAVWLAADDGYDRKFDPNVYSATELLNPVRMIILTRRLLAQKQQGSIDIEELVQSRIGHAVHKAAEVSWMEKRHIAFRNLNIPQSVVEKIRINPETPGTDTIDIYIEKRTSKQIMGVTVTGMLDFCIDGTVEDLKTTKTYNWVNGGNDEKYMQQESIYRWLNPEIVTDDHCNIHFMFTDFKPLMALADKNYPQSRIKTRRIPLMSLEATENFIKRKLETILLYQNTEQDELPKCTPEELWQMPATWAWYKDGAVTQRSTKNFKSKHEAEAHAMGKGLIVERPGVVKRCSYCDARVACTQAAQLQDMGLLEG